MTKYYAKELKKLRENKLNHKSVREVANACGVSVQMIHHFEKGNYIPSNKILKDWLGFFNLPMTGRSDILRSVVKERELRHKLVKETIELEMLTINISNDIDAVALENDLTDLIMEIADWLSPSMREGQAFRVRSILIKHLGDK